MVVLAEQPDALTTLAVAGVATDLIELGVGIVPTYPRHPLALAQQAASTQVFCGGRLTLGVGVSHRPVIEDLHGLDPTLLGVVGDRDGKACNDPWLRPPSARRGIQQGGDDRPGQGPRSCKPGDDALGQLTRHLDHAR